MNLIYSDIILTPSFVKGLINIWSIGYVYTDEIDDNYEFSTLHSWLDLHFEISVNEPPVLCSNGSLFQDSRHLFRLIDIALTFFRSLAGWLILESGSSSSSSSSRSQIDNNDFQVV